MTTRAVAPVSSPASFGAGDSAATENPCHNNLQTSIGAADRAIEHNKHNNSWNEATICLKTKGKFRRVWNGPAILLMGKDLTF